MAGCGRPDLTRTPQMGVLEIFDAPGRSQAISLEEEDVRTHRSAHPEYRSHQS